MISTYSVSRLQRIREAHEKFDSKARIYDYGIHIPLLI